ncbi:hypothetical protein QYE76_042351 [Lolium multiflorum]|uniref:RNase H type-1 domain-containing protein n=1 Tax=Lolium multiflorum TaxID=4521 RepID=A0AAD8TH15_LOLMU|nr:hypothetical protein QYE76_042351 [Lolium multiflorum]
MSFDGAFNEHGAGSAAILTFPTGDKLATVALGVKRLTVQGDSQLLVHFSNKVYKPKDDHMIAYLEEV